MEPNLIQKIVIWALPVLFAITAHEAAHGWVAKQLGDPTAARLGRVSLNPLRHIDPIGTILVPAVMLLASGFVFGWAKPVPIAWGRLHRPRRDIALVALAGPGANLLMGIAWALVAHAAVLYHARWGSMVEPVVLMGVAGIFVNTILLTLNLIPLPPLDGGRVLVSLLPPRFGAVVARVEPYGIVILLVLIVTDLLIKMMGPPMMVLLAASSYLAGIPLQTFQLVLTSLL